MIDVSILAKLFLCTRILISLKIQLFYRLKILQVIFVISLHEYLLYCFVLTLVMRFASISESNFYYIKFCSNVQISELIFFKSSLNIGKSPFPI